MFKIICVTDRKSCHEDFFVRIEKIAMAKPDRIIFRDKESTADQYVANAQRILEICGKYGVPLSVYSNPEVFSDIHLRIADLRDFHRDDSNRFIGVSVHSLSEATKAESMGVDYITAGHIFTTACKADLAPRGLSFLKEICDGVKIPVYAIGGINADNIGSVAKVGAAGACVMSGFMSCENPEEFIAKLRKNAEL